MFQQLEVFRMASALALHSGARQAEIASNVANADTPGYRARDVVPFAEMYANREASAALKASRGGHVVGPQTSNTYLTTFSRDDSASPNGNTVSLESEMIRAIETRHAHETALAVYESARNILRTALGRPR